MQDWTGQVPQWQGQVLATPLVDIGAIAAGRGRGRGMPMAGDAAALAQGGFLLPSIPAASASAPPQAAAQQDLGKDEDDVKEVPKCPLHKKPNGKCKFCQKHAAYVDRQQMKKKEEAAQGAHAESGRTETRETAFSNDRYGPLVIANKKTYGLPPLLQTHIVESTHFKSLATTTFEDVVQECSEFATAVEPYLHSTQPSGLFVCLYRFFTLGIEGHDLQSLLDNRQSPFIRCAGFLFVRYALAHDKMWVWLEDYVLDEEQFYPTGDKQGMITIGEYVVGMLTQEKFFGAVVPRLPAATQRLIQERLAPVEQWRQRNKENKNILDTFRESGTRVEANVQGDWLRGKVMRLLENNFYSIKVRIRTEDGKEIVAPLGKVILQDGAGSGDGRSSRSRSPRRGSGRKEGLSYNRGRTDAQLIAELKDRERNKAVVGAGKNYAQRVSSFDVMCALPGAQGQEVRKLISQEFSAGTLSSSERRGQQEEQQKQMQRPKMTREEEMEHRKKQQALFEKYGAQKATSSQTSSGADLMRPDVLRLG